MIPSGEALIYHYGVTVRCRVEVLMVAFSKGSCRVRGEYLEDSPRGHRKGDKFGNHDTTLTEEILAIIRR